MPVGIGQVSQSIERLRQFARAVCLANGEMVPENARTSRVNAMYERLAKIGLPRQYVRDVVCPDWWDDAAAESAAGFNELALLVSRHLGVTLSSIRAESESLSFQDLDGPRFKKARNKSAKDISAPCSISLRAAWLAAAATDIPYAPETDPAAIRSQILGEGHRWVGLESLVAYCWSAGIPVLHVSRFPSGTQKMDGMAAMINDRPVIIINRNDKSDAWLLFILAHELGHICRGHLQDGFVVDQKIDGDSSDADEREADEFAVHLLTGSPGRSYVSEGRWPNANQLARMATKHGFEKQVDPGHVVLNYAYAKGPKFFPLARAALAKIEQGDCAPVKINQRVHSNLDWSALPEPSSEFLNKVLTG